MAEQRQYDIVVFGATGYTGKLTAEHIALNLPTDLRWAIAGRSATKLEAVAQECKRLNPNRTQPGVEVVNLTDQDLDALTKKTKLVIAVVGPYTTYGEHAFRACAKNGTHYLDATGEVPWHKIMIEKYEKEAQASGAIMVPQIGFESAPSDLIAWMMVDMIRERFSAPAGEINSVLYEVRMEASGGTLATLLTNFNDYTGKQLMEAHAPYAMCPIPAPKAPSSHTLTTKLFGLRIVPDLGILTTWFGAGANLPIVQRSWGLLGGADNYGPNFRYNEYLKARNHFTAIAIHILGAIGTLALLFAPIRWLIKQLVFQPGDGPSRDKSAQDCFEYRAIGKPDTSASTTSRAFVKMRSDGSIYRITGVFLAEGAMSVLRNEIKLTGGIYTPACLGQTFIDRLAATGDFRFEKKWLEF